MMEMKFYRVGVLPEVKEPNALYLIRNEATGKLDIAATNSTGAVIPSLTQADILSMIEANIPEAATALAEARTISITGDATWEVSFDGTADTPGVLTLASTGVAAGEYPVVTVDAKGRVTAGRALTQADIPSLDGTKIISAISVDTSGNAASATLAASATKLATARTINGVAFDGQADIVINAEDSVARIAASEKGAANGVATLGADGVVPSNQLPSFVDDVIEVDDFEKLPGKSLDDGSNGVAARGKIYVVVTGSGTEVYRYADSDYFPIPTGVGLADSALRLNAAKNIAMSGDATWSVSFDGSDNVTAAMTLADSGVTAGTYAGITFDSKGRAVAARALIEDDMPMLTHAKVLSAQSVIANGDWV